MKEELVITDGSIRLFPERRVIMNGDLVAGITFKQLEILQMLMALKGRLVSVGEILDKLDPEGEDSENSVRSIIKNLRKVLRDIGIRRIATSYGGGYRWVPQDEMVFTGLVVGGPWDGNTLMHRETMVPCTSLEGSRSMTARVVWYAFDSKEEVWRIHVPRLRGSDSQDKFL